MCSRPVGQGAAFLQDACRIGLKQLGGVPALPPLPVVIRMAEVKAGKAPTAAGENQRGNQCGRWTRSISKAQAANPLRCPLGEG